MTSRRQFSLPLYLLIVCAWSWPFQLLYLWQGYRPVLLLSMIGAGIGTFVAGRFLFGHGFADAGWKPGRLRYYFLAFGLALLLWLLPVLVEMATGINSSDSSVLLNIPGVLIPAMLLTVVPAFGEEFSWRGYLLPRLLEHHSQRRALLIHGLVTWFWHWPFLVATALAMSGNSVVAVIAVLLVSLIPAVLHAVVFAWFWQASGSLLLVTFYHVAFDEVRDALQATAGFGWMAENWQMLVLIVLGAGLLWKGRWSGLSPAR